MIDILLATYNGEKFIEEQIESLLSQTYKNWKLIIHDDGSNDNTVNIIKKLQEKDERIILIEDGIKCGGAGANFLHILKNYSTADYIIFCDQDDIWLDDKLSTLYQVLKDKNTAPYMVYCNAYFYDGEEITGNNVVSVHRNNLNDSLFLNGGIQGCSLMFNKQLKDTIIEYPEYIYMHDHFITIAAVTFGKTQYIDKSLMLYRQHDTNVTGHQNISLINRLKRFFDVNNPVLDYKHYKANVAFYDKYKVKMTENNRVLFEQYIAYPKSNLVKRLAICYSNQFQVSQSTSILLLKTLIRIPMSK